MGNLIARLFSSASAQKAPSAPAQTVSQRRASYDAAALMDRIGRCEDRAE